MKVKYRIYYQKFRYGVVNESGTPEGCPQTDEFFLLKSDSSDEVATFLYRDFKKDREKENKKTGPNAIYYYMVGKLVRIDQEEKTTEIKTA